MTGEKVIVSIDYKDAYVQPLLKRAIEARLPADLYKLVEGSDELEKVQGNKKIIHWKQYEEIDFDRLMGAPSTILANSYVIRKALIRKHYLSTTVAHWLTKNPDSVLKDHVKTSFELEVDYAEFLDDALLEAYELKESWDRNASLEEDSVEREWWILKPGMSDRGQGIRLFSSEEELQAIFNEWDPPSDDEAEDDAAYSGDEDDDTGATDGNAVMTSHLRHFVAQPYIDPPLLMPDTHTSTGRKFHIRTYVVAVGALKVCVYKPMLALFAGQPYSRPNASDTPNESLSAHLTNTCLQSGEREGSVEAFWSLPATIKGLTNGSKDWRQDVFNQICEITGQVFEAAARSMSIHFQPLPNAFEIFGLDFIVDAQGVAWLLEVNAFPDFAQTGGELNELILNLFEDTVDVAIKPFVGIKADESDASDLRQVLDIDLGRR